jgi:oxygen-independent coproporphyrinogen-3 oxidase
VTTEANPESTTPTWLAQVREAGVTRLSLGMQSARPHVLAVLDRTHDPARVPVVVDAARSAGFASVSVDLIYGTPGDSLDDWQHSLDAALAMAPDHVSAYALIVEPGTRLAAQVARGQVAHPDDDLMAAMYEVADERFEALGWQWYEISNWARDPAHRSRHNQLYWCDADWWGVGPGAHSHVRGVRWWNVKHPAAWAARLADGDSPAAAREVLDDSTRRMERVMLGVRTRHGAALADVVASSLPGLVADGLVDPQRLPEGRVVLTRQGRLLADPVTLRLVRR